MQPFTKFQKILYCRFRIFLNFASYAYHKFDNKKWGSLKSLLCYKHLNLKLRVPLTSYTVAIVTYYANKITIIGLPMARHVHYTNIVASLDKQR